MAGSTEQEEAVVLDWPKPEVARLTMCRGEAFNTITLGFLDGLEAGLSKALAEGARAVVLTGQGKAFCAGAHVSYFTDPASPFADSAIAVRDGYVVRILEVFGQLRDAPVPTIAAINGFAFGGGCELALACDFRLMSERAKIGLTETRLGAVAAGGGVQLLAGIVGRAKALEILLLGDQWTADQALSIGLANAVHPPEALEAAAIALADRVLACSPISIAQSKQALNRCETAAPEEADRIALDAVGMAAAGPEWREGMAAFKERRLPSFASNGRPGEKAGL